MLTVDYGPARGGGGFGRSLRNQNFLFLPIFVITIGQFSLIL